MFSTTTSRAARLCTAAFFVSTLLVCWPAAMADSACAPTSETADLANDLAEHACAKDVSSSETIDAVRASAMALASACAASEFVGLERSLPADLAEAFVVAQACDCASGETVVEFSSRAPVELAASGDPDGVSSSFVDAANEIRIFSEEHCKPGTRNGVLEQSAEECVALTGGNVTETTTRLGASAGRRLCVAEVSESDARSRRALAVPVSQAVANATADAISQSEFACSFVPSALCALSDEQVQLISSSQVSGFFESMAETVARECGCEVDAARMAQTIRQATVAAASSTHAAVCESASAEFLDMADPVRDLIQASVVEALATLATCDASPPGRAGSPGVGSSQQQQQQPQQRQQEERPASALPFAKCGSNDYALALATDGIKHVAPAIATACCTPGYACTVKSRWYASCRPEGERPSPGWNGTVVTMQGCEE